MRKYDLCLIRGEPLYLRVRPINNGEQIDLNGYTSKMQIRFGVGTEPIIEVDTLIQNNYIYVMLDKNKSLSLPLKKESYYSKKYKNLAYDLLIYNKNDLKVILKGEIKIIPTITEVI